MSDPLVCGNCGTPNRANAKFCIGCAGRLPGLAPAGAMVPPNLAAPAIDRRERTPSAPAAHNAPSSSFWLHLGLVGLTMVLAFVAWCIYVLHGRSAPWDARTQAAAPPAAEARETGALVPAPVPASVPAPVPAPALASAPPSAPPAAKPMPEPARTAASGTKADTPADAAAPDAVAQALALSRRNA
ncbi:MAG: zinc ribbon domain-containing protein, partial [Variovorax sp.]|nr:zinc ribbon domain-containing protein [Variovorax sp.]